MRRRLSLAAVLALAACAGPSREKAGAKAERPRPTRIELPEQVITAGPPSEIAIADKDEAALFDGGTRAFQNGDYSKAALHFDRLVSLHPESGNWLSALYDSALSWERQRKWAEALERFDRYLQRLASPAAAAPASAAGAASTSAASPIAAPSADEVDAAFHAALDQHELGRLEASAARLHALSERAGLPAARRGEALTQEAVCRIEWAAQARSLSAHPAAGDSRPPTADSRADRRPPTADSRADGRGDVALAGRAEGERLLRAALQLYEDAGKSDDGEADPALFAQGEFWLGEIYRSYFEELALDPAAMEEKKLADALEGKAQFLLSAQGHYLRAIRRGDGEWATAAGFRIGELYEALHQQLTQAPVPKKLDEEQQRVYRAELAKKVRVLIEKAIRIYEQTLATAERVGARNAYVEKTGAALERMRALLLPPSPPTN